MLSEFVFHGVPQGFDAWGTVGDGYYESFYGIEDYFRNAKTALVVEVRKDAIGFCSYYTYVRPQNVVAHGGRTGSYFGMSLKCQGQYCIDVYSLYRLFDKIYEEKIIGTILSRIGNTEKFLVANLSDAEFTLKAIAQLAEGQIKDNFANDFEDIDSSFTKQYASTSIYYNLDDVNCESFFNSTRVYGKVFISPEYSSKDAIIASLSASDKKMQSLRSDYEKQIADLQAENSQLTELRKRLSVLESDYNTAQNKVIELQDVVNSLQNSNTLLIQQLNKNSHNHVHSGDSTIIGKSVQSPESLPKEARENTHEINPWGHPQEPVKASNGTYHNHTYRRYDERGSGCIKFLFILLPVALLIVLIVFLINSSKSGARLSALRKSVSTEQMEGGRNINSINPSDTIFPTNNQNYFQKVITLNSKYPNVSFIIRNESDEQVHGALQYRKRYNVECRGVDSPGEWKADGLTIYDRNNKTTALDVINNDRVVLSYYIDNDKVLSIEYLVTP